MRRIDAWECPKCGHAMPRTVDVCRCGHQRTGTESAAVLGADVAPSADHGGQPDATTSSRPAGLWMGVVMALLVAGGAAIYVHRPDHPSLASAPAAQSGASDPADATAEVSRPARPAPQWPTDPALWKQPVSATDATTSSPVSPAAGVSAPLALEDIVSAALPAVVLVQTTDGRGTGFYVSADTVVTNAHVVDGATYVTLRSAAGDETPAVVTSRSSEMDLAALHVAKARPGQAVLALGSSGDVRVGEEILAIGSPMGLQNTVTRGIVSSLRRLGAVTLVQTDAAINPGNSGGPLVDQQGRVVAVATMKISGQAESLGFGVAAEHVRALLDGTTTPTAAGRRPVDVLNAGGSADADSDHDEAVAGYERFMAEASKRADQLDRSWSDLVSQCMSGAPQARGERGWFALWEGFDNSRVSPACSHYYVDFKTAVDAFQRRMVEAGDAARRSGIYPGEGRDIRHRYRLDSPDW